MRNNQPVTNVETLLPENEFIYSQTNLKGIIVEANKAFADISGFTQEQMVGQPHNIVRHPDMPPEAYADMWEDLKAGRPWQGLVKNRRSDGGFYWVVANASPVRENGQIVGYQSVRTRPSREQVAAAEAAYKRLRNGDRSIRIEHGRVIPARLSVWARFNDVRVQTLGGSLLMVLMAALLVLAPLVAVPFEGDLMLGLGALTLPWALWMLFGSMPRLNRDLVALDDFLRKVLSTGDLRHRFSLARYDALGRISRKTDRFISSVQATIQGMEDTARGVADVSGEVRSGVVTVDKSARKQADATQTAAAGIEEITVSIAEVAEHASSTHAAAASVSKSSKRGAALSEEAVHSIRTLADTVKASAARVELLGEQSIEISRITDVIREIADQTNLLALNAAIEAARAGEAGRGFAVVADEVRKLAERTTKATLDISQMVSSISADTHQAVEGMRAGAVHVEDSVKLVGQAEEALREIDAQMSRTLEMVNEITHSSSEQRNAMQLMAQSVEQVADMTDQNASVVSQTSAAVERLDNSVARMRKAVGQFAI